MMASIAQEIQERLNSKLVTTLTHLNGILDKKKESNGAFNDEIKGAKRRINCLVDTLETGDLSRLMNVFDEFEVEALTK